MTNLFTIGCDPEYFLISEGKYIAAPPFIEGTKSDPLPLPHGGYMMYDNVAVEFGIQPATNEDEWLSNIMNTAEDVRQALPEGVELACVPSAHFDSDQLIHPECQEFGCEPDFNAWTGKTNIVPANASTASFRSCGGHIHVGFILAQDNPTLFIQWMDYVLGMVSVSLDRSEEALARRKLYGKAGCYRPTDYGAEYRTLSNFWVKDEAHIRLQYSLVSDLCVSLSIGKRVLPDLEPEVVQRVINEGDDKFARQILAGYLWDMLSKHTKDLFKEVKYTT
jgi:hypothetical protein